MIKDKIKEGEQESDIEFNYAASKSIQRHQKVTSD